MPVVGGFGFDARRANLAVRANAKAASQAQQAGVSGGGITRTGEIDPDVLDVLLGAAPQPGRSPTLGTNVPPVRKKKRRVV
jgi:hypothetical protein